MSDDDLEFKDGGRFRSPPFSDGKKFGFPPVLFEGDKEKSVPLDVVPVNHVTISIPVEVAPYARDIQRFADAMVYKLGVHSKKGKWEGLSIEKVVSLLDGEVQELREAIVRGNLIEILLEAADVANYALIISAIAIEGNK